MIIIVAADKLFARYDVLEAKLDSLIGVPKKRYKLAVGTYKALDDMLKNYAKSKKINTISVGNKERDLYQKYRKICKQCVCLDDECVFIIFSNGRDQQVEDVKSIGINNGIAVHIVNYNSFRVQVEV